MPKILLTYDFYALFPHRFRISRFFFRYRGGSLCPNFSFHLTSMHGFHTGLDFRGTYFALATRSVSICLGILSIQINIIFIMP